jgi:HD superfamily phosphohydrolase
MNDFFEKKYLKYKKKYFSLSLQHGGLNDYISHMFNIDEIPFLNRIKYVKQSGIAGYINHKEINQEASQYSRYEHSIDVANLTYYLMEYKSDKKYSSEQKKLFTFTSLIHDIQHPAFSHVIDQIFGQDLQKTFRKTILDKMKQYLSSIKINYENLIDDGGNPPVNILKASWPELNTDRIDYTIKDSHLDINDFIPYLRVNENDIVYCTSIDVAKRLSYALYNLSLKWKSPKNLGEQIIFSRILNSYINLHQLDYHFLYEFSDSEILQKILNDKNILSLATTKLLNDEYQFSYSSSKSGNNIFKDITHLRLFNPLIKLNNTFIHLTDVDEDYKKLYTEMTTKMIDIFIQIDGLPSVDEIIKLN